MGNGKNTDDAEELRFREKFYSEKFYNEKLKGFRIRLTIIASASFLILLYMLLIMNLYDKEFNTYFKGGNILQVAALMLVMIIMREIYVGIIIEKKVKQGKRISDFFRYANSFIEISIPTISIIVISSFSQPVYALMSPVVLFYFVFIMLSTLELDFILSMTTGIVAGLEYTAVILWFIRDIPEDPHLPLFGHPVFYMGKGLIMGLSGIIAGIVALQIRRRVIETYKFQEERNRIERLFGQQVSREIVDEVMNSKIDDESRTRRVCVMFLDVRNFSGYAADKRPEEIVKYQNDLFGFMIDTVNKHHGIINQILGDGFMATFGAPVSYDNDCQNAVNSGLEIVSILQHKCVLGVLPQTKVGIGIHTGEAVTGNVGTSIRKQYSITGNVVIHSSRIEQLNKEFGSQLLISRDVLESITTDGLEIQNMGSVMIKGSTEPIEIFRLA